MDAAQNEAVLERRAELLDDLLRLIGQGRVERFAYAAEMASDSVAARETLRLWQTWWRDVMLLASGSQAMLANVDREHALREHAGRFGVERAKDAGGRITQTLWQLDHNANARLALEVLLLDFPSCNAGMRASWQLPLMSAVRCFTATTGEYLWERATLLASCSAPPSASRIVPARWRTRHAAASHSETLPGSRRCFPAQCLWLARLRTSCG